LLLGFLVISHNGSQPSVILAVDHHSLEGEPIMPITATVVIDPGHGGSGPRLGGSDPDHAVSPSGAKEKNMTLELGRLVKAALQSAATNGGHTINVLMTRDADVNLSLAARANVARDHHAQRLLSIHFNGFDHHVRGTETLIRGVADGNVNHADDKKFATKIQNAALGVLRSHDSGAKDRGVKDQQLGVLNDRELGNTSGGNCRACMIEVEFIDVPAVDALLNTGPNAGTVRNELAQGIANAIIDDLANP
jgi:N-acetylmuramoyl-L-alanine amidase